MMKVSNNTYFRCCALLLAILCLSGSAVFAQEKNDKSSKKRDFCSYNNYSHNGKVSYKETREVTVNAGNLLTVDGKRNGGIEVRAENRPDVLIRACIQTVGVTEEEARSFARNIRIETSPNVRAENIADESNWGVSYEILVPRSTNLKLTTHNGGIALFSVEGTIEFDAHNGGIFLSELAGDVKGKTRNGGLHVKLAGNGWKGDGLDVQTTNGGVHLEISENYAANIKTGTVNGGFNSEISQLSVERKDRSYGGKIDTILNGGGAPVRVITTNGGVKITSSTKVL